MTYDNHRMLCNQTFLLAPVRLASLKANLTHSKNVQQSSRPCRIEWILIPKQEQISSSCSRNKYLRTCLEFSQGLEARVILNLLVFRSRMGHCKSITQKFNFIKKEIQARRNEESGLTKAT